MVRQAIRINSVTAVFKQRPWVFRPYTTFAGWLGYDDDKRRAPPPDVPIFTRSGRLRVS